MKRPKLISAANICTRGVVQLSDFATLQNTAA